MAIVAAARATAGGLETARCIVDTTDHDENPGSTPSQPAWPSSATRAHFPVDNMTTRYQGLTLTPGIALFGTRLELTVVEAWAARPIAPRGQPPLGLSTTPWRHGTATPPATC